MYAREAGVCFLSAVTFETLKRCVVTAPHERSSTPPRPPASPFASARVRTYLRVCPSQIKIS